MSEKKKLFEIKGLVTQFHTEAGVAKAVDGVSFDIYEGEVLGIVGDRVGSGVRLSVRSTSLNVRTRRPSVSSACANLILAPARSG